MYEKRKQFGKRIAYSGDLMNCNTPGLKAKL